MLMLNHILKYKLKLLLMQHIYYSPFQFITDQFTFTESCLKHIRHFGLDNGAKMQPKHLPYFKQDSVKVN